MTRFNIQAMEMHGIYKQIFPFMLQQKNTRLTLYEPILECFAQQYMLTSH